MLQRCFASYSHRCSDTPTAVRTHRPASADAFTLVELLVVIGIIGLLISIALPALRSVRQHVRCRQTAATISALGMGAESFRADGQLGGNYPPSHGIYLLPFGPPTASPHASGMMMPGPIQGANLLAWALVGADLLGTPGFRNLDGKPDDDGPYHFSVGGWVSDIGSQPPAGPGDLGGLYALQNGVPVHKRANRFVDVSRMSFPKYDANTQTFTTSRLKWGKPLYTTCFLDSFDQPILYYRANPGQPKAVDIQFIPNLNQGIYCHFDNEYITGGPPLVLEGRNKKLYEIPEQEGIDLGAGPLGPDDALEYKSERPRYHPMSSPGFFEPKIPVPPGAFGNMLRDPSSAGTVKPQNERTFAMISAGPDGRFGTHDDIANFEINQ